MYKVAELFAGIGGVTDGFEQTGLFKSVFLNDIDSEARRIYLHNKPKAKSIYTCGSIENITSSLIYDTAGGDIDGLLGCPPCQGLSNVGTRDPFDPRNELIIHMARLAKKLDPSFIVVENVPSLLNSIYFEEFINRLSYKYSFCSGVLNAAEFGVPQLRRRAIIIGIHKDYGVQPTLPVGKYGGSISVFDYSSGKKIRINTPAGKKAFNLSASALNSSKSLITIEDALGDLPQAKQMYGEKMQYRSNPQNAYQRKMREKGVGSVHNHAPWNHSEDLIKRMKKTMPGFCPSQSGKTRNKIYFSQAYGRLHGKGVSRTITTNFHNPGSGRFTHHREARTLTIREALRLQSFPDRFVIPDDCLPTKAEKVTGNAFPPILAKEIALNICKDLEAA